MDPTGSGSPCHTLSTSTVGMEATISLANSSQVKFQDIYKTGSIKMLVQSLILNHIYLYLKEQTIILQKDMFSL